MASGSIFHWDGQLARISYLSDYTLKNIWYNNDHDIYAAGTNGLLLHYDGSTWRQLDTNTKTTIMDIWGISDQENNKKQVLATVSTDWWAISEDYKVISIHEDHVSDTLKWKWPEDRPLMSIWFEKNTPVYVAGGGVVSYEDSAWSVIEEVPAYGMYKIRGSDWNNIFAVGAFGMIAHYNGSNWHYYDQLLYEEGSLKSVAVTKDIVVAVGVVGSYRPKGIIITGSPKN
ncbi:MAG: hypothetical protein GF313_07360 [Caldithrix sp.]|nr:hypothetical protein [Caldithrix sp.]